MDKITVSFTMHILKWIRTHTVLFLFIVTFVLYTPSLFGKFVWDDEDFVYANTYVQEFQIGKFFTENAIAGRGGKQSNYYRPIQETLYALEYKVVGQNPFLYHLNNIVLHAAAGAVMYLVLMEVGIPYSIVFFSTLLFLVHPVQTEAVSYISGRSDMLYVLFLASSALLFLRRKPSLYLVLSVLLFLLALLSKETALVGVLLVPTLLWLKTGKVAQSIRHSVPFLLIALTYLVFRFTIFSFQSSADVWGNSPYATNIFIRLSTFFHSYFTYVGIMLTPHNLHMERDVTTPILHSFFTVWTALFLFVHIGVSAYLLLVYKKYKESYASSVSAFLIFSGCMFFYSGIVLLNGIFYEHYLYLALFFFFTFIVQLLFLFFPKKWTAIFLVAYVVILVAVNIARQWVWISPIRFYTNTLQYAPKSVRIRNGLGMAYADEQQIDKAIYEYNTIIEFDKTNPFVYHNLANAYASQHNYEKAEQYYLKAISVNTTFHFSYNSLITMYMQKNNKNKLRLLLPQLERSVIDSASIQYALAQGYEFIGDNSKANEYYVQCCSKK